ncbi:MAG: HTH-type transcriptional repressor PurR [Phycisphaerae bacterium]|nr:HTH-type transcriptional repressor PurR [Phycisphaerae bacterium]
MATRRGRPPDLATAQRLAALLRRRLRTGLPGSRLPGRAQLAEHLGCTEHAARAALRILVKEGILEHRGRSGFYVRDRPVGRDLRRIVVLLSRRKVQLFQQAVLLGMSRRCERYRLAMDVIDDIEGINDPDYLRRIGGPNPLEVGWLTLSHRPADQTLLAWRIAQVPIVVVDAFPRNVEVPTVACDIQRAIYEATETLILLGHRDILFSSPQDGTDIARERQRGYRLALQRHGLEVDESLMLNDPAREGGTHEQLVRFLSAGGRRVSGIIAADQRMGCEALSACDQIGLRVPRQVSVVSAGTSLPLQPTNLNRLSRFDQGPSEQLGRVAVDLLMEHHDPVHPASVLLGATYTDRGSTAPPPDRRDGPQHSSRS